MNIRQGDVILISCDDKIEGKTLPHLTLALGEVTGHSHQIVSGDAKLVERDGSMWLKVASETATLSHEEHAAIQVPQGTWLVQIQREYEPDGWRYVAD